MVEPFTVAPGRKVRAVHRAIVSPMLSMVAEMPPREKKSVVSWVGALQIARSPVRLLPRSGAAAAATKRERVMATKKSRITLPVCSLDICCFT